MPHGAYAGQAAHLQNIGISAMKRARAREAIEAREAIRTIAYELAQSGACDGWQEVWRTLRARFSVDQLTAIFENPLCQLDIDLRCHRARNPQNTDGGPKSAVAWNGLQQIATWKPSVPERVMRRPERLVERIEALLADGIERTAVQISQQLGTSRNEVLVGLRVMLADGALQVTRCVVGTHGGRGARVFAPAGIAPRQQDDEPGTRAPWPLADSVVTAAMDAFARHA